MECLEFWFYGISIVLAGDLPDAAQAVAALGAVIEVYDIVVMPFLAQLLTLSTSVPNQSVLIMLHVHILHVCRVGNALGSGNAQAARVAVAAAVAVVPLAWACLIIPLIEPHLQRLVMRVFTDESDALLLRHMRRLMWGLAGMLLADGWQLALQGFLQHICEAWEQKRNAWLIVKALSIFACLIQQLQLMSASSRLAGVKAELAHSNKKVLPNTLTIMLILHTDGAAVLSVSAAPSAMLWLHSCCSSLQAQSPACSQSMVCHGQLSAMQGSGKQRIGVCVNLAACYCIGLPLAVLGGFYFHGSVEGILAGVVCSPLVQAVVYSVLACRLNWEKLALEASAAAKADDGPSKQSWDSLQGA
ncbi:hypothetical protein MMC29_007641 [Sticta canariensis]|nr:hypothetical protein [Sticta canariensis]